MKSIGDLTELESVKLQFAQAHLKSAAFDFVCHPRDSMACAMLFTAAREFHRICDEIGFEDYWPALSLDLLGKCNTTVPATGKPITPEELAQKLD